MNTRRTSQHPGPASHGRSDDGRAFLPDPYDGAGTKAHSGDALAEMLAEEFVEAATSAKEAGEAERDSLMPEEIGGPFTLSRAQDELAQGHDASNPEGTLREPFPMPGRVQGVHALASWLTRS